MKLDSRRLLLSVALVAIASACVSADSLYRQPGYVPSSLPLGTLPEQLKTVGVTEKLGNKVDLNLTFIGENGYPVQLKDFFNKGKPVILDLVYYNCPQLCTLLLNHQMEVMKDIAWTPGNEYEVVTITIDPRETFADAKKKKDTYLFSFGRPAPGWHFLADYGNNAEKLAEQVGFNYKYDARIEQYAHPTVVMVLTPKGTVARYLYWDKYKSRDLRFALAEASEGRTTMAIEKVLLFCYQYDANENRYVIFAVNIMKAGGVLIILAFGTFWWRMIRADRRRTVAHGLQERHV